MIEKLIDWCMRNRAMVMLLTAFLVVAGIWAVYTINLDAIPDLSDVQVVIKTRYPGQAASIVEEQVTYPLATEMLKVPDIKVVRGYSMFGASFIYVIFKDGTDLYWARSRVLEQLNYAASLLPSGVKPALGPDATGVGWVYEYALVTGPYSPAHPDGAWEDPQTHRWYPRNAVAGLAPGIRGRLVHHRIFEQSRTIWVDPETFAHYGLRNDAPPAARSRLERVQLVKGYTKCPLDGSALKQPNLDLADLRSLQDWYLRYGLNAVPGISEVAPIGGFVKEYQVVVDPVKLLAYHIPLDKLKRAIQRSNDDVGARVIESAENEYIVRGVGYLGELTDQQIAQAAKDKKYLGHVVARKVMAQLRKISLGASEDGTPIYLRDVAQVREAPDIREGVLDWNGRGETVGGIVVMRFGQNALTVIDAVKAKLAELEKGLPPGVAIRTAYDRSALIERAVHTLRESLVEEITVVGLVCILFLLHARSELVAVFVVPTGVLTSILVMKLVGINANIMSLGGIAIAIGVMVDSSIIMVENSHKHLDREEERQHHLAAAGLPVEPRPRTEIIAEAAKEVGPSLFFALLIIVVSFLPIFVLNGQSGRMFKPLAFTKTFAMGSAAFLAVTVIPVLMSMLISARVLPKAWGWRVNLAVTLAVMLFPALVILALPSGWVPFGLGASRHWIALAWFILSGMLLVPQKIIHENANPVSRLLQAIYHPLFILAMRFRWLVLIGAVLAVLSTLYPLSHLGSEFMPPLEEGDLLYMPSADPSISIDKGREVLQQVDALIKQFPEVKSVFGKVGRAMTATDPAPTDMFETVIRLQPDESRWRQIPVQRFYAGWPHWLAWLPSHIWKPSRPITMNELIHGYTLEGAHVPGLDDIVKFPGLTNSWTMPIKTRIDMLSTGIKTPVGIKVVGPNLLTLSKIAQKIADVIATSRRTAPYTTSAYAEKTVGANYLDIRINRDEIARYELSVGAVEDVIKIAMGGMNVTTTVEGLERYPVDLRYPQELRDNVPALKAMLVPTRSGAQVPLGQLASFVIHKGPPMIKSENARPTSWVYVDIKDIDVGTYVADAQKVVAQAVTLPAGYNIIWSGQYEYMQAAKAKLMVAVPMALGLIILLLYTATHSWLRTAIVLLAVPFSLVGAMWLLYFMGYHLSLAVWVGVIALAGLDAETGMVMLLYLDNSFERFQREGRMRHRDDLWFAVHDGAVKRIRPKMMTVAAAFIGLVPLLWAQGAGADTMRRLAAPMIGGLTTSFIMELLIYPVVFYLIKSLSLPKAARDNA